MLLQKYTPIQGNIYAGFINKICSAYVLFSIYLLCSFICLQNQLSSYYSPQKRNDLESIISWLVFFS